jgi:polyisoprenoid-binding protein YceI
MKKVLLSAFALAALTIVSCGGGENETTEETPMETVETTTYNADLAATTVNWRGEVAGVYGHDGYVNLKSGSVEVAGGQVVGGTFTVDMTAFYPTDSASYGTDEGSRISDLQGHLTQDDFFASERFPTSTFVIKSVNGNTITGDLTIRDKTNEETLNIESMDMTDAGMNMTGTLVFNRQKYDVKWVHYMKDMVLSDDIAIKFNVVATK